MTWQGWHRFGIGRGNVAESGDDDRARLAIARGVPALRAAVAGWRAAGETVALVPTMGALHKAHVALIETAGERCDRVVVSVFVNPRQFNAGEDFARYPRQEADDIAILEAVGVDLMFAPGVEEMYPDGAATTVSVAGVTEGLCGAIRPGHFDGVATVCAKLFLQCQPDVAVFGAKDYQQLLMIRRMVRDLDLPMEIAQIETVRDEDGLATSSRNAYLSPSERAKARHLNAVLAEVARRVATGEAGVTEAVGRGLEALAAAGFDQVEYLDIRDAETLQPVTEVRRPARVLAAVRIGATRLIDNRPIGD